MSLAPLVLAAALSLPPGAHPGTLTENVASRADATQTYTLYLPSSYDASKAQPLLFVFDPRSRGTKAAEIFRPGAEEFGWIVISSNQTRSDGDGAVNERAVRALLPEANRYASDPRRIYVAGFSGTGILAHAVGLNTGVLAGVIAVGARLIDEIPPARFTFAHYGFAGDSDFNNREMRLIDSLLEQAGGKTHRFDEFPGDHRWITPELATDAIGWMEVVAMKQQRRSRDAAVIARLFERDAASAAALESRGDLLGALRRYGSIARTYDGLHDVDAIRASIARLAKDPRLMRDRKDEKKWDDFEVRFSSDVLSRIPETLARLRHEEGMLTAAQFGRALRIAELQRRAKGEGAEARTARRLLESAFSQTTFYIPMQLMARGEYPLAAAAFGAGLLIHADRPLVWYNLGAAQARAGARREAFESLEKAVSLGFRDVTLLTADDDYASLRKDPRFETILSRLR